MAGRPRAAKRVDGSANSARADAWCGVVEVAARACQRQRDLVRSEGHSRKRASSTPRTSRVNISGGPSQHRSGRFALQKLALGAAEHSGGFERAFTEPVVRVDVQLQVAPLLANNCIIAATHTQCRIGARRGMTRRWRGGHLPTRAYSGRRSLSTSSLAGRREFETRTAPESARARGSRTLLAVSEPGPCWESWESSCNRSLQGAR